MKRRQWRVRNAECGVEAGRVPTTNGAASLTRSFGSPSFTPNSALATPHSGGFTYVALLAAIVILGISLGAAGKYWSHVMLREKEEELIFRGDQYRNAIARYFYANNAYPPSIESLLNESPKLKHNLRQQYKDPITGEDFELFRDMTKGNRITGVYSKSEAVPLRQTGFSEEDKDFEGKQKYNEWKFIFAPQQPQQQVPGRGGNPFSPKPPVPPPPR